MPDLYSDLLREHLNIGPQVDRDERLLTLHQASKLMGLKVQELRQLIAQGELDPLFRRDYLLRWIGKIGKVEQATSPDNDVLPLMHKQRQTPSPRVKR